jgi:hypothetical protein
MRLQFQLKQSLRIRAGVIIFCCVATALVSSGQADVGTPASTGATASAAAPTCADLRLVPAPRECTAVATIPIGDLGFFVAAQQRGGWVRR